MVSIIEDSKTLLVIEVRIIATYSRRTVMRETGRVVMIPGSYNLHVFVTWVYHFVKLH